MAGHSRDPRIGELVASNRLDGHTRVALVGFPSDEGVRRNGGRPGAAAGPRALREALFRMTPDARAEPAFRALLERTVDLGDVAVTGDLEGDQELLATTLEPLIRRGVIPIIVGGGHETSYGHFLGYVQAGLGVGVLNWDAHADVRPLVEGRGHSGSPFRQALDHASGLCRGYSVAGLMPWRVAAEHADFVRSRGGEVTWREALSDERIRALAAGVAGPTLASFDLDLVDVGAAPGVSAPGVGGLDVSSWLLAARRCAENSAFTSFDVVELNPEVDEGGRTAVLAALTVWQILAGLTSRDAVNVRGTDS